MERTPLHVAASAGEQKNICNAHEPNPIHNIFNTMKRNRSMFYLMITITILKYGLEVHITIPQTWFNATLV